MLLLDNLTDKQKSLLTRMSYLDIDLEKFEELKSTGKKITISDLENLIQNPDKTYLGDLNIKKSTKFITGVSTTNLELLKEIEDAGLGKLEILEFVDDSFSGFQGICFKDLDENTGFSFRGTDVKNISSLAKDSLTDVEAFLTNNTIQIFEASRLFDKHSNKTGKNYLFGHSLGGFLAENIYAIHHENIKNAFVINPLHINSEKLTSAEQVNAFNNPDKFSCFVTGGDYVSSINPPTKFSSNIHYVRNNKNTINNLIGNHLVEAAKLQDESFEITSYDEAFIGHANPIFSTAISVINNSKIKKFFAKIFKAGKDFFKSFRTNQNEEPKKITIPNDTKFNESLKLKNYIDDSFSQKDLEKAKQTILSKTPEVYNPGERREKIHE